MLDKDELLRALDEGEVALLPSDTVYGLFADALNVLAINKVDEIKKSNKPHLILVSDEEMLNMCVNDITPLHRLVMDKYWPGPLTILFKKSEVIPNELTKGSDYIAIRMPNNKLLLDIIREFDNPLISTSANITNEDVVTDIKDLNDEIKKKVSFIYDGGTLGNTASTLIKIEDNKIIFLREGELASRIKEDFKEYL